MSRVVRTFSFEEICSILNAKVHEDYINGKQRLTEIGDKVSLSAKATIRGNDLWNMVIRIHDDYHDEY